MMFSDDLRITIVALIAMKLDVYFFIELFRTFWVKTRTWKV